MRDTFTIGAWVGGAMLITACLMVLCQHKEGERTRAALQVAKAHMDNRIRTLDARLTDMQAETNRKKLASVANPPLDPKRLAKASQELDQLIATPPAPPAAPPTPPTVVADAAGAGVPPAAPLTVTSSTQSPEAAAESFVRVCHGGRYYHRAGCQRVRKRTMPIVRADAELQGWSRCPTCQP
jgi:hypothetical protein